MVPRYSISNITVKRYCGDDTSGAVLWENSTVPKFFQINLTTKFNIIIIIDKTTFY